MGGGWGGPWEWWRLSGGRGVFHSILGNDLHYEASEHFMRAPERPAVTAETFSCSFRTRRDAMEPAERGPGSSCPFGALSLPPPTPPPKSVSSSLKQEQIALKGEMGIEPGGGRGGFEANAIMIRKTR